MPLDRSDQMLIKEAERAYKDVESTVDSLLEIISRKQAELDTLQESYDELEEKHNLVSADFEYAENKLAEAEEELQTLRCVVAKDIDLMEKVI